MSGQAATLKLIEQLKQDYPGKPFLALGQTVFWDEPTKAVWRRLLDAAYPEAKLIAGVHDTDYFAKTTALVHTDSTYVALPHDDAKTRGLWSAAGELSALFGSEDLPTIAAYEHAGVPFHQVAGEQQSLPAAEFASRNTEAWGWRGIVETGPRQHIAADVPLAEFLPALNDELNWGFDLSAQSLAPQSKEQARKVADQIRGWITEATGDNSNCRTLSDLYQALLPRLYALVLGGAPANFETTASTLLFRFNPETCALPRFRFVDLFLNPATRQTARDAYSAAVAGGGMYGLDEFGPGAMPFDIVVPGIGRGTLHVTSSGVTVDLPGEHKLALSGVSVTTVAELASLLKEKLGENVILVGKAVALISMIAAEFLILFHETASGYTDRTLAMNDAIRATGISLDLLPIVRLQHGTWDALAAAGESVAFRLPNHLAQAFGRQEITADEFSARWRSVAEEQKQALTVFRNLRTPRALLAHLDKIGDPTQCWSCHLEVYNQAQEGLAAYSSELQKYRGYIAELRRERFQLRGHIDRLQREKGDFFRAEIRPLHDDYGVSSAPDDIQERLDVAEAKREQYEAALQAMRAQVRQWSRVIRNWRADLRRAERSESVLELREIIRRINLDAQSTKLEHVRAALITSAALPHTNARPTAWWLPLVDPSGKWLSAMVNKAEARLERV